MSEQEKLGMTPEERTKAKDFALRVLINDYADFNDKLESEIGLGGGWSQCSREHNGKRYRVIVGEYGEDPVTKLREANAKTQELVDAARAYKLARHGDNCELDVIDAAAEFDRLLAKFPVREYEI